MVGVCPVKQDLFEQGENQEKYLSTNPISTRLVDGFFAAIGSFVLTVVGLAPRRGLEIGIGEGQVLDLVATALPDTKLCGFDIAPGILDVARKNLAGHSNIEFALADIHRLSEPDNHFDFVVCCEVLEHVDDPLQALSELQRVLRPGGLAILSVPREPVWRAANMARLKYLGSLGNTPGHLNHWGKSAFVSMIESRFSVQEVRSPFPWTCVLAQKP